MNTLPAKARLADHLIDGGLEPLIRELRGKGQSFETIALAIWEETNRQVQVSGVTVLSWAARLGFDTGRIRSEAS